MSDVSQLTVTAPSGAHFAFEEVKIEKGTKSLGDVPLLVWDDLDAATQYYGQKGVLDMLDGTSPRVSFQGIARRLAATGKPFDDIAKAQIEFRPGTRTPGQSTPSSRAASAAKRAAEKVSGDALAQLMAKISSGEISLASFGIEDTGPDAAPEDAEADVVTTS